MGVDRDWEQALFHFILAAKSFETSDLSDSLLESETMLYRANLARRLPMEKVAEIWDRAQAWKTGDTTQ